MTEVIPADIQAFLLERISTYEALRIVLWLAEPQRGRVPAAVVAQELRVPVSVAQEALSDLVDTGLVEFNGNDLSYRYNPLDPALDEKLRRVAEWRERDEPELVHTLAANSISRLRRMAYLHYGLGLQKPESPPSDRPADSEVALDSSASLAALIRRS